MPAELRIAGHFEGGTEMKSKIIIMLFVVIGGAISVLAQSTEFTYQSKLLDNNLPATANYDFEFRLFDLSTGGTELAANQRLNVAVADGVFTVQLDFGAQFPGASRWLEISVRPAGAPALGAGGYTQLLPRQPVTSVPYSIRSLNSSVADTAVTSTNAMNATQLGGVAANQYVLTGDTRLSDARNPLPGSSSYVRNSTGQQSSSNFNISGTGNADIFGAATQFNIGGSRVLSSAGTSNLFAGLGAGQANTTGSRNSFFGRDAGGLNTTGASNSFFGGFAGSSNTEGTDNSFFGLSAGRFNTTGNFNSFFGRDSGRLNTTGSSNSFFGRDSGRSNTTGADNSFFGEWCWNIQHDGQ